MRSCSPALFMLCMCLHGRPWGTSRMAVDHDGSQAAQQGAWRMHAHAAQKGPGLRAEPLCSAWPMYHSVCQMGRARSSWHLSQQACLECVGLHRRYRTAAQQHPRGNAPKGTAALAKQSWRGFLAGKIPPKQPSASQKREKKLHSMCRPGAPQRPLKCASPSPGRSPARFRRTARCEPRFPCPSTPTVTAQQGANGRLHACGCCGRQLQSQHSRQ